MEWKASPAKSASDWPTFPPPPAAKATKEKPPSTRCDFSDTCLDDWLKVEHLQKDTVLSITAKCLYDAHTAVRHAHEVNLGNYALTLNIPDKLRRKNSGFGPWLHSAVSHKILAHDKTHQVAAMKFVASAQHVHDTTSHFSTLDIRLGGKTVRALLDSGATCSCISEQFVTQIGTPITPSVNPIAGIGGALNTVGTCTTDVKLRKFQQEQQFQVLDGKIAGYDVILGQDFCQLNSVSITFGDDSLSFTVGKGDNKTSFSQSLEHSKGVKVDRGQWALPMVLATTAPTSNMFINKNKHTPVSRREKSKCNKHIRQKKQVAYRIIFSGKHAVAVLDEKSPVPPEIQKVIDKHSHPGGTLCGEIPPNTHATGYDCKIDINPGAQPVYIRQYRLTPLEKSELLKQIDAFIAKGWIEPSTSAWSSSVLFIPKPNGKLRFCVDFRKVNQVTTPNRSPLANPEELLDSLQGKTVFSALDLASGYYQLKMHENSREVTSFPTPYGLMQWKVMPMGLSNAPAIFQQAMNSILRVHIQNGYCLVYLDDIIIMSCSVAEHCTHLNEVLSSLNAHNLYCQLPKCFWGQPQLKYLGHMVDGDGVRPDPSKVDTLDKWHPPVSTALILTDPNISDSLRNATRKTLVKACRRFLGFMNYFNRFIPRYSAIAACLHDQTKDDAPPWSSECTAAWQALCTALKRATLMHHPVPTEEYHVYLDASIRGIGGVLMQYHDGQLCPVAYSARKMIPAETNYSTTQQKLLAMIFCFLKWRCYLEGAPKVFMHTDHEPLTWLKTQTALNRRQSHWLEFMARFRYEVLYVKGDKNVVADA